MGLQLKVPSCVVLTHSLSRKKGRNSKNRPSSWAKDHKDSGKSVNNYWKVEEPVGHFVSGNNLETIVSRDATECPEP